MKRLGAQGPGERRVEAEDEGGSWQRDRPFVCVAMALMGGIVLGELLPWLWGWLGLLWVAAAAMGGMWWRGRYAAVLRWGLVGIVALGAGYHILGSGYTSPDDIAGYVMEERQLARVRGTVVEPARHSGEPKGAFAEFHFYRPTATRTVLAVDAVKANGRWRGASGRLQVRVNGKVEGLREGQRIEAAGWLEAVEGPANPGEFDYRRFLIEQHGAYGRLSVRDEGNLSMLSETGRPWWQRGWAGLRGGMAEAMHGSLVLGMEEGSRELTLLEALLLGRRGEELGETYEQFRDVGLAHVMAISGAHLGILLGMTWLGAKLVMPTPRWVAACVVAVLGIYLLALPWRVPILRASVMAFLLAVGYGSGRAAPGLAMWALAAVVVLLWDPGDLFSPGFQLSFGIVAGLLVFTRPVSLWLWPGRLDEPDERTWRGWGLRWGANLVAVNLVAFVTALPIVAYHFQLISPAGLVMSIAAIPPLVAVLGVGFVKMLVGIGLPSVSEWLAWPLEWSAWAMLWMVEGAAEWRWASVTLNQPPTVAWTAAGAMVGVAALGGWFAGRKVALGACVGLLVGWAVVMEHPAAERWLTVAERPAIRVRMLAVGHGSCYLVETEGKRFLFDAGSHDYSGVGEATIVPALRRAGVRELDAVFVSHAHLDHYNGLMAVVEAVEVGQVYVPAQLLREAEAEPTRATARLVELLAERGMRVEALGRGWEREVPGGSVRVLWPGEATEGLGANDESLVMQVAVEEARLLLTGDVQAEAIARLIEREPGLGASVMELPHHGEDSGASRSLVEHVGPGLVLQSANRTQAERGAWEAWLSERGVARAVTAKRGMVEVAMHGDGRVRWRSYRERGWEDVEMKNGDGTASLK